MNEWLSYRFGSDYLDASDYTPKILVKHKQLDQVEKFCLHKKKIKSASIVEDYDMASSTKH